MIEPLAVTLLPVVFLIVFFGGEALMQRQPFARDVIGQTRAPWQP